MFNSRIYLWKTKVFVLILSVLLSEYKSKTKLHLVQIYFATPTFDKITKDVKAHFETKLSTIGGTMGLLTGFSIISGIEVMYYAAKFLLQFGQKCFKNCKVDESK